MLSPFGWFYGKIINLRNTLYARGIFRTYSVDIPIISIGNITVGGTGKTPLVSHIAEILYRRDERVGVISRGYKRRNENERVLVSDGAKILADVTISGDEPFELAQSLLGKAIVVADADRASAAKWLIEQFAVTVIILDDAFQHRKLERDLDILVIDATNPFGNEKTMPSGILREPIECLARADLLIISRSNLSKSIDSLKDQIRNFNNTAPILRSENRTSSVTEIGTFLKNETSDEIIRNEKAMVFCGIGNPESFVAQLSAEGFEIVATKTFRDHHFYSKKDIESIQAIATKTQAETLITTAKDAGKLVEMKFSIPCLVLKSELIIDNENILETAIGNIFE